MKKELIDKVKNWLSIADDDLKTVYNELKAKEPVTRAICFHAQQCVEKYLKAYLTFKQKYFRKTHDIEELIFLCLETDKEFEKLRDIKAHELIKYGVEVRYPDEFYLPSMEEAERAAEIAEKVKNFVLSKLKESGFEP